MTQNQLFQSVQEVFRSVFQNPHLSLEANTSPSDIQRWDSFSHVSLILSLEKRFGVKFSMEELHFARNVAAILKILEVRLHPTQ